MQIDTIPTKKNIHLRLREKFELTKKYNKRHKGSCPSLNIN